MDEIAKYNKERWEALAEANVEWSRPFLDLDTDSARKVVDAEGLIGEMNGHKVLCLASGGGQQSAAFALLGADVTVFDLSETQLQRDREAAAHYNLSVKTIQGDMRDLSCFDDDAFDIVWHAFSINFVPDARPVFREAARVLRIGGLYRMKYHNPFTQNVDESEWNGDSYPLRLPYIDSAEIHFDDTAWEISNPDDGEVQRVEGPREFRHTLSGVLNNLAELGFILLKIREETADDPNPEPGTWEHLKSIAPPWLTFWAVYRPEVFAELVF
jgi:SAM-dependent methyltransferase